MGKYGEIAVNAVRLIQKGETVDPREAWEKGAKSILDSSSDKKKNCPISAFLGLCEEGKISKIPCGKYTRSVKNKYYALKALKLLEKDPSLSFNQNILWKKVIDGDRVAHNGQMDVVISLWNEGLIKSL